MSHLITRPLTSEAFADFGQVIDTSGENPRSINDGKTDRFHDLAELDFGDLHGRPCLSIFRAQPQALPFVVRMLERHTLSTQAFVPLEPARFLIVVAKPGSHPTDTAIHAFISNGHQGVNYRRGTWHHPLIALESETDFLVLDREGPGEDCEEWFPGEPVTVGISP